LGKGTKGVEPHDELFPFCNVLHVAPPHGASGQNRASLTYLRLSARGSLPVGCQADAKLLVRRLFFFSPGPPGSPGSPGVPNIGRALERRVRDCCSMLPLVALLRHGDTLMPHWLPVAACVWVGHSRRTDRILDFRELSSATSNLQVSAVSRARPRHTLQDTQPTPHSGPNRQSCHSSHGTTTESSWSALCEHPPQSHAPPWRWRSPASS